MWGVYNRVPLLLLNTHSLYIVAQEVNRLLEERGLLGVESHVVLTQSLVNRATNSLLGNRLK
jgi:hypothetical protein